MGQGLSRRRLLRAGVIGAGLLTVAPQVALRAVADGFGPATGLWAAVSDPAAGRLFGLVGTDAGPVVHHLAVARDGTVRLGPMLSGPATIAGFDAISLALVDPAPALLGADIVGPTAPAPGFATNAVDHILAGEPDPPGPATSAPIGRPVAAMRDAVSGSPLGVRDRAGFATARLGHWSVRQHGPDDEADHLSMLTVSHAGEAVTVLDGLVDAAPATLAGAVDAPVLTVADGAGAVRVIPLGLTQSAPPLADHPTTAVTRVRDAVVASAVDADGRLLLRTLAGGRWSQSRAVSGTAGITAVLAIAGTRRLLVTGPDGAALVDPGAR